MVCYPHVRVDRWVLWLASLISASFALVGCSSFKSDALLFAEIAKTSFGSGPDLPTPSTGLDLKYRYLMVQVNGQNPSMLALSTERQTVNGLLEVWVASDGGTIQTLNGRLSASSGLATQWISVRWVGAPVIDENIKTGEVKRLRDVMPHYTYNVADTLSLTPVNFANVPQNVMPAQGDRAHWAQYNWFQERIETHPSSMRIGDAWIALGVHRGLQSVVASYQCVDQTLCLKTARWPLETDKAGGQ